MTDSTLTPRMIEVLRTLRAWEQDTRPLPDGGAPGERNHGWMSTGGSGGKTLRALARRGLVDTRGNIDGDYGAAHINEAGRKAIR